METAKFYLHMKGPGYGCDYTIGCNNLLVPLKANNSDDAKDEASVILKDYGAYWSREPRVDTACLIEATNVLDMNVLITRKTIREAEQLAAKQKKEAEELKEFARLKAKFGQ